ncbi:MAG: c-type cytochrome [bacterium]
MVGQKKYACLLIGLGLFMNGAPVTLYGQGAEGINLKNVEMARAVIRGEQVYERACTPCHGLNGDGNGPFSGPLSPKPRDFTKGKFKFRTTTSRSLPSDQDLFNTISKGIPGTFMPAWKDLLSEEDRMNVVQYIKTFSPRFTSSVLTIEQIDVSNEIPYSDESAAMGRKFYEVLECVKCHGETGRGDGPSAKDLKDEWGYPLPSRNLTQSWTFRGGNTGFDIYCRLMSGITGAAMPSVAESFNLDDELLEIQIKVEDGEEVTAEEQKRLDAAMAKIRQNIWHLVNYIKSLSRSQSLLHRLFVEDTEVTK